MPAIAVAAAAAFTYTEVGALTLGALGVVGSSLLAGVASSVVPPVLGSAFGRSA